MIRVFLISIFFFSSLFAEKPMLSVTILPQKYFVEKIVKDKFDINVMVAPGSSPHSFEPKPSQMKALFNSKIYFMVGEQSEKAWIDKFKDNAKNTVFIDTTFKVPKIAMIEHHHEDDEHSDDEDEYLDPHIWLDPNLVKIQAKNIYNAIIEVDSKNRDFYMANYKEFIDELNRVDKELEEILKPLKNRIFMVFHPSWGYFAKRYNLVQISVEVNGKEPKPAQLLEIIKEAKKSNIKTIFTSLQFSSNSAKALSTNIPANVVSIDPLSEDWSQNLIKTAKEIAKSDKR